MWLVTGERVRDRADGVGISGVRGIDDVASRRVFSLAAGCAGREDRSLIVGVGDRDRQRSGRLVTVMVLNGVVDDRIAGEVGGRREGDLSIGQEGKRPMFEDATVAATNVSD